MPWRHLPHRSYLVIPVLDFVPIGLLFEGLFPHVLGVLLEQAGSPRAPQAVVNR